MKAEHLKCDVLCVGGGIGGMMAAIRAAELGAKVIVAEKGNVIHSGKGGGGCDHYLCYIPEVHGPDMNAYIEEMMQTQQLQNFQALGMKRIRTHIEKTFDIVRLFDSWGIHTKQNGKYHFAGHAFPGGFRCLLKYEGRRQKPILTEQARKRKVKVVNRVMVFDLIANNGSVAGAIGIDTRTGKIIIFEAPSVILGTGGTTRLYPAPTPGWFNNNATRLSMTGDGRLMAFRAGAELQDAEIRALHVGPKYLARFGQATWVGVFRDPYDKPLGPFVTKPQGLYGDVTPEVNKALFLDYARSGRGPVYMDTRGISEKDYKDMVHWFPHEGLTPVLDHMKEEGLDHRKHPIEFMTYDHGCQGRVVTNEKGETTLKGLYACGEELAPGVSNASVFGWISGENAYNYSKQADKPDLTGMKEQVGEKGAFVEEIMARDEGAGWKEVNVALQQLMQDYAGMLRSQPLLESGIFHLARLRKKAREIMRASNAHEAVKCLETLNLIDLGEIVSLAALDRKETRGNHVRVDYPLTNPRMNGKTHIMKKVDGKIVSEWRPVSK
jgi:succinate dehydrogenase/fumarate reductase flavoprotein subunit